MPPCHPADSNYVPPDKITLATGLCAHEATLEAGCFGIGSTDESDTFYPVMRVLLSV